MTEIRGSQCDDGSLGNQSLHSPLHVQRRLFLSGSGLAIGAAALHLLQRSSTAMATEGAATRPGDKVPASAAANAKAKRAIYLFMSGAPSQLEMWDPKSALVQYAGQELPVSVRGEQRLTTMTSDQEKLLIAPSPFQVKRRGKAGVEASELVKHTAEHIDDLALIRSVHTSEINHDPAITFCCTGDAIPGKPSLGSWLSYGLGSMNDNLPTFMVMTPRWSGRGEDQAISGRLWGSGFLPSAYQGIQVRSGKEPFLYLKNPSDVSPAARRIMLDSLGDLNRLNYKQTGDPETLARISQYEMAFRLQSAAPELVDLSNEPAHILDLYGPEVQIPGTYANCCIMARRMAERDVRFVQIFHRGWDQHFHLPRDIRRQCHDIDRPTAGLLKDLGQRGMLDDTLVVWGGEFGRTAYCQGTLTNADYGRDHHPGCFSVWLAGAGVRGGLVHGATDDFGYNITRDAVHVHDLNATILERFGIDHLEFTFSFQGLNHRLTGVEPARVVREILA